MVGGLSAEKVLFGRRPPENGNALMNKIHRILSAVSTLPKGRLKSLLAAFRTRRNRTRLAHKAPPAVKLGIGGNPTAVLWAVASWTAVPISLLLGYFLYVVPLQEKAVGEGALGIARHVDAILEGKAAVVDGALGKTDMERFRDAEALDKLLRRILKQAPDFLSLELIDPEGVINARLGEFNVSEEGLPTHVNVAKLKALDSMPEQGRWLFRDEARLRSYHLITRKDAKEGASFYYLRMRFSRDALAAALKQGASRGLPSILIEHEGPVAQLQAAEASGIGSPAKQEVRVTRAGLFTAPIAQVPLSIAGGWRISVAAADQGGPSAFALAGALGVTALPLCFSVFGLARSLRRRVPAPVYAVSAETNPAAAWGDSMERTRCFQVAPPVSEEALEEPLRTIERPAETEAPAVLHDEAAQAPPEPSAAIEAPAPVQSLVAPEPALWEDDEPASVFMAEPGEPSDDRHVCLIEATKPSSPAEIEEAFEEPAPDEVQVPAPYEGSPAVSLAGPAPIESAAQRPHDPPVESLDASPGGPICLEKGAERFLSDEPPPDLPWFEVVDEPDRTRHVEAATVTTPSEYRAETKIVPEYLDIDLGPDEAEELTGSNKWEKARTRTFHRLRDFLSVGGAR